MATFLKKQTDSPKGGNAVKAWHPSFRNEALLPDTKVVRTAFFLNALAVLVVLSLLGAFLYQEYLLADLRGRISQAESGIAKQTRVNAEAVAIYKKFQDEERRVQEVNAFVNQNKINLPDLLFKIGATLPKKIALRGVDYNESGLSIKGYVSGSRDQATGTVSSYERILKGEPEIGKKFESILVTAISPDAQSGRLSFDISLGFVAAKKDKK